MLLLDDEEEGEQIEEKEKEKEKKRTDEFAENRRRGQSFRPPLPGERRSGERSGQKSLERKKSIENGVMLPIISNKKTTQRR